mmetsp:Transcript_52055/g.156205  ORF Transcript_52055/g.156205 Transcript_52055/m.156205 type:complete len:81 (-) Transcript_52055:1002-1244(-)
MKALPEDARRHRNRLWESHYDENPGTIFSCNHGIGCVYYQHMHDRLRLSFLWCRFLGFLLMRMQDCASIFCWGVIDEQMK